MLNWSWLKILRVGRLHGWRGLKISFKELRVRLCKICTSRIIKHWRSNFESLVRLIPGSPPKTPTPNIREPRTTSVGLWNGDVHGSIHFGFVSRWLRMRGIACLGYGWLGTAMNGEQVNGSIYVGLWMTHVPRSKLSIGRYHEWIIHPSLKWQRPIPRIV